MSSAALIALLLAGACYWLSGARTAAYLAHACAYVPFITLDTSAGGLVGVDGLSGPNVRFKLTVRLCCGAILLACLLRQRRALPTIFRVRHLPVLLLFGWSVLWIHRAGDPWISIARLGELMIFFLSGIALYLEAGRFHGPREVARWHALALASLPAMALVFVQRAPELASHVDASGLQRLGHKFLNANSLGFSATILCLWAVSELHRPQPRPGVERGHWRSRLLPGSFLVLGAWVVFSSRSRTSLIALLVGLAVLYWPARGFSYKRVLGLVLALAVVGTSHMAVMDWMLRGESVEGLATGTGRTGLWSALLQDQVPLAPVGGAGYLMLSESGGFLHEGRVWNNAHNTYVGALVSCGIPGLLFVLAIVLGPLAAARSRAREAWSAGDAEDQAGWTLLYAMSAAVTVASVTGFGVVGHPNPLMHFHYGLYAFVLGAQPIGRAVQIAPRLYQIVEPPKGYRFEEEAA